MLVVCSGVKSILDVAATLERLETLNVAVLGYRTDRFPGFYLADSGHPLHWRVDSPAEVGRGAAARRQLGTDGYGMVLANPRRRRRTSWTRRCTTGCWQAGWRRPRRKASAERTSRRSCSTTSIDETGGASLATNVALVLANARLAGEVAAADARPFARE